MFYKVYDWEGTLQGQYDSILMASLSVLINSKNEKQVYSVANFEDSSLFGTKYFCGTLIKVSETIVIYTDISGYAEVLEKTISKNKEDWEEYKFQFKTHRTKIERP